VATRAQQRRAAVFALYQHDLLGSELGELLPPGASLFTRALAHAASDRTPELDAVIARHSRGWTVDRIAPLERAIMRVALLEMLDPEIAPGERPMPAEGAIDEAVETAKEFCGADAPGFVNGILGAALRELRDNQPA
jgi:transcription antitermination protein NusB